MSDDSFTLNCLPVGHKAKIIRLTCTGAQRRRMMDLGFVQGAVITALACSPSGDPVAYLVRGAVIALRCEDAQGITVAGCI